MLRSLNQITQRLRSLAISHKQINHFYFGDVHEFLANGDINYPACFCEEQAGTIDRTNHQQRFNFRLYFADLVGVSERTELNETEVLSDMRQVANDMLSVLMNPVYQEDWIIVETANIISFTEGTEDMVAGVIMDIGIILDFLADSCEVPADDVEFEQTIDMPRTKIHTYTATGGENSFSVATLSGKHILGAWRAGMYKRAIATLPDESEKIQVGVVDAGNGQGIVSNGTVTLQTGDILITDEKVDLLYYGT